MRAVHLPWFVTLVTMIMISIAIIAGIRADVERAFDTEGKDRFGGYIDPFSSRGHSSRSSRCSASSRSDSRSFTAAEDRPENRSHYRTPAGVLAGSSAVSFRVDLIRVGRIDCIPPALGGNGFEVNCELVVTDTPDNQFRRRSPGDHQTSIGRDYVTGYMSGEYTSVRVADINGYVAADSHLSAGRDRFGTNAGGQTE